MPLDITNFEILEVLSKPSESSKRKLGPVGAAAGAGADIYIIINYILFFFIYFIFFKFDFQIY
jgi:hypothetical protein